MSLATDFIVARQPQAPTSCIAFGFYRSPPAIGGEVGLHKDFNTDKATDTPPGRIDDVLVDSRLYLRWLAISASLNPLGLIAFRLFSSHNIR